MAEKKEKQYVSDNAQLMAEWDWEKNNELGFDPKQLTLGSNKKVWWKCSKGHNWETKINNRSHGNGCPYCSGKLVIKGENDLETTNPILSKEWDYEKNSELTPSDVLPNSNKKVWWKCEHGHSWQATICNRTRINSKCPYCSGRFAVPGENDLVTKYPELIEEWDYNKNHLDPKNIKPGSSQKVWWKCKSCGYEWETSLKNRTANGTGCALCSQKRSVQKSIARSVDRNGSLHSCNPILASEWHKKNNLLSTEVSAYSNKKVWWQCRLCGHEWQAVISSRSAGVGCPQCARRVQTSFPEQVLLYYIKREYPLAINGYRDIFENQMELDIFVPELNIGLEYDGSKWHTGEYSKNKEQIKYEICRSKKILLIRLKESQGDLTTPSADIIIYVSKGKSIYEGLNNAILELKSFIPLNLTIDVLKDQQKIRESYYNNVKEKSLASCYPKVAQEWNYEKNGGITPQMVYAVSGDLVWWKCKEGHEWQASIANRVKGRNCPYCSGKKALEGFNDLATISPQIALEWNFEKNKYLSPKEITYGSNKKVWWKCKIGHEWQATVASRTTSGTGCPFCSNQRILVGFNDLETLRPDLADQWNYERNYPLTPKDVMYRTTKKVWWKCNMGHEWQATVASRNRGNGCPECAKARRKNGKV